MALQRTVIMVAYDDGQTEKYNVTPKVEIHFERTYKVSLTKINSDPESATKLYQLAWEAMRAAATDTVPSFDKWIDTVAAIEVDREAVHPFGSSAQDGGSPSSASSPA